jgi:hypothetical protein
MLRLTCDPRPLQPVIDDTHLNRILIYWGYTSPPGTGAVPEALSSVIGLALEAQELPKHGVFFLPAYHWLPRLSLELATLHPANRALLHTHSVASLGWQAHAITHRFFSIEMGSQELFLLWLAWNQNLPSDKSKKFVYAS